MKRRLYLSLRGGLGNQLFSMCVGVLIANQTGRNILVDLRNISPRESTINDFNISWNNSAIQATLGNSRLKNFNGILMSMTRATYKILSKIFPNVSYLPRYVSEDDELENIAKQKPLFLNSHYENLIFPKLSKDIGCELIIKLRHESPKYLKFKDFQNETEVTQIGVHVRRGDFVNWQGGSQLLPTTYYKNAIKEATCDLNDYLIWIYTDESDSVDDVLNLDARARKFSAEFQLSDSEELLAFSSMDRLIISRSTFSQWSALISEGKVYFPSGSQHMENWREVEIE